MNQDKSRQIAPQVVLAQHGNKDAMRNIYIEYHKSIFLICRLLLGDTSKAMSLTSQIFVKMFASVDKLDDHMAFEQWFYSLAINMCKSQMNENNTGKAVVTEKMKELAHTASQAAKVSDKYTFERSVLKLLEEMLRALPDEAKIVFFYANMASLDAEKIALLEKTETEVAENSIKAVDILIDRQIEKLRDAGVDVSPFVKNPQIALFRLASKAFVPDVVHANVSESVGINVAPYAEKKEEQNPVASNKTVEKESKKTKTAKKEKKGFLSKGDLILFLAVIIISVGIFSGIKIYRSAQKTQETSDRVQEIETVEKPVLTWNGASASSFSSGTGTKSDPFIISNGGELAYLANLVNSGNSDYSSKHYRLGMDIVLNDTDDFDSWISDSPENRWTPIGSTDDSSGFSGTFDGDGHTVSGMYVNGDYSYCGLFGEVNNGCIKNLTVKKSYVSGIGDAGGIAGYVHGNMLIGADIVNCTFSGAVISSEDNAGGIVGRIDAMGEENFMIIERCCSFGYVTCQGSNAGGIAGKVFASGGDVKISDSFSVADVSAQNNNAGGIAGLCSVSDGDGSVYNCYFAGDVNGGDSESAGAITGMLSCENGNGVVSIMYCTALDGSAPTLTGIPDADRLSVKGVKTASDIEMQNGSTFEAFDFDSVWSFSQDGSYKYPVFRNMETGDLIDSENSTI